MAQQVRAVIRPADTLVRLGGDEFLAICENLSGVGDALTVADRIRAAVTQAVSALRIEIPVSASIGIAMAQTGLETPDAQLTDADTAMYRAKEAGRDGVEVFGEELRAKALARIEGQLGNPAGLDGDGIARLAKLLETAQRLLERKNDRWLELEMVREDLEGAA